VQKEAEGFYKKIYGDISTDNAQLFVYIWFPAGAAVVMTTRWRHCSSIHGPSCQRSCRYSSI